SMSNTVVELLDMLAKFNRIKPIIEAEKESARGGTDPGVLQGGISLSEVEFRYQEDGAMILAGIDLDIQPGNFVALVGPSGCGKSTIFRLLLGFERPDVGQVLFDGQDLDGLDIGSVRIQIGSVLQSAKINAGSILENISGSGSMDLDDVWMAVRDAGLEEDVEQMPMGLHTVISEGGGNISGGQKQRLLIARALVKKPRILLLDEATSALDNKTQAIVTASLNRRKVTRVAIAHRLSTIQGADQIIVMKQGRIDQVGKFQELTQQPGLFASMMAKQQA
ncbi:MAG TPA: ATP-binding cassette domain-containing protein, partial [Pseudomonadales bacterium]|nr:ATP-binding cassette domain-containing protein [Pseudomonadales bacterium]